MPRPPTVARPARSGIALAWLESLPAWMETGVKLLAPVVLVTILIVLEQQFFASNPSAFYVAFLTAALLCAVHLGRASGFWTLALSLAGSAFFVLRGDGFAVTDPGDAFGLFAFGAAGAVLLPIVDALNTARTRASGVAEAATRDAEANRTLLTELSHRVGNDLNMLVALATLQTSQADPACRPHLRSMADRIVVFGRVYRRLSQSPGGTTLDIQAFLEGLCDDLRAAHLGLRPIGLEVRVERIDLSTAAAVIVGLCVNEAVTNALKYAFDEDRGGAITVVFGRDPEEADALLLEVRDDGVGLSAPSLKGTGMGSRLARSMAAQLGGTYQLLRDGDFTVSRMRFSQLRGGGLGRASE